MKDQQQEDDVVAKSCMRSTIYNDVAFNDSFIKSADASSGHAFQQYWAQNPQPGLNGINFDAESLSSIQ